MMRVPVFLVTVILCHSAWAAPNVGVIGGVDISIEQAPYMALLYTNDQPCGGSIIDNQFILTVDHCCDDYGPYPQNEWIAQVGSDGYNNSASVQKGIVNVFKYEALGEDYRLKPNLCIVKLDSPLEFGLKVDKISVEEPEIVLVNGTWVYFTAFGHTSAEDKTSRRLRRGIIPIVDNDLCKEIDKRLPGGQICAGDHLHNACYGDSAGTLTYGNYLIGVLSETDCGSNPALFSRISGYRTWIYDTINKHR